MPGTGDGVEQSEVIDILGSAETGDVLRVEYVTGLREQSALQPDETEIEKKEDGRWHYVTMLGDPIWIEDDDKLAEAVANSKYASNVELERGGA